ncbi:hypothetical protein QT971_18655 [Microcoleus sp. herbarium19]|uniref:hypothetical protein n=1 Tax=unclassified Microcoleus TaxID=2642155 RepID=UPI002FD36223
MDKAFTAIAFQSLEKTSLLNFGAQLLNGCILISINYEVNLKISKNLQFAVFVCFFQELSKELHGLNGAGCPQSAGYSNLPAIGRAK